MHIHFPHLAAILLAVSCCCTNHACAQGVEEAELIAILKSDAPKSEKAITCKLLAVHGTKRAVEELAKLLPDEQLTSWARTALEAIPDPSADEALRSAMASMHGGRSLIGVINSIATRRDEQAVEGLAKQLTNSDEGVAAAAAVALGHIGNSAAQAALETSLAAESDALRSAAAEGCILIAERHLDHAQADDAATLYAKVRAANVPRQRVLEATRGLIVARKSVELLTEQLHSADKDQFGLGLRTARELPDKEITDALVAALDQTDPGRQGLVVLSLAERDAASVLPAILSIAESEHAKARGSALQVLGVVGNAASIDTLLAAAMDRDTAIAQAAMDALATLQDEAVNDSIKQRLSAAQGLARRVIIETIGARRIYAVPELLAAADDGDQSIRAAALTALGATVEPQDLPKLIARATDPPRADDQDTALQALRIASTRMPDRDACAMELTTALAGKSLVTQSALIEILGSVGGATALATVAEAAADDRDEIKDAASQALGKWMTPDAAPELLELAKPKADDKYRIRALRGYLRIARQMQLSDAQRAKMCEAALRVAARDEERNLALQVLEIHPSLETLAVALAAQKDPLLKDAARDTSLRVAEGIPGQSVEVKRLLEQGGLEPAKIEILRATYGSGDQQKVVTETIRKGVGKLPIVSLSAASYNAAFDGDPAPGVVKQLVVEYTLDGRQGTASFKEDAAIILPRP